MLEIDYPAWDEDDDPPQKDEPKDKDLEDLEEFEGGDLTI